MDPTAARGVLVVLAPTGPVSGAMSGAPIDVSAEAKNKWGKTGKAALVAEDVVVNEKFRSYPRGPLETWVKANAKALVKGDYRKEIAEFGLWAISKTWSTKECKINMESAHNRDTSGGLNVGATGIAKGGASGSSSVKTNSEGWTVYTASEVCGYLDRIVQVWTLTLPRPTKH